MDFDPAAALAAGFVAISLTLMVAIMLSAWDDSGGWWL